jgi:hypothetical protein
MRTEKPVLGIVLSNAWSILNLLHSGAMTKLQEHFRLVAWVAAYDEKKLSELASKFHLTETQWRPLLLFHEGRRHQFIRQLQKSLLLYGNNVETERIKSLSWRAANRPIWQTLGNRIIKKTLSRPMCARFSSSLGTLRERSLKKGLYVDDFESYRPNLLLICNPVDYREDPILYEGLRRAIPVLAMVASWDNLTSKGAISEKYAEVFVWNNYMRTELLSLYSAYHEKRLRAIGIPRFDVYGSPLPFPFTRGPFFKNMGLDPSKRLLLYANSSTTVFPMQPQVIRHLIEGIEDNLLPDDLQILIRCHPYDDFKMYKGFERPGRVAVWWPQDKSGDIYTWCPEANTLWTLAAMIRHSDIVVNTASTIALEASIADRPTISIAYDGDSSQPLVQSIRSVYGYSHQLSLTEKNSTLVCESREELFQAIQAYLKNPKLKEAERQSVSNSFCLSEGNAKGNAVNSLVDAITRFGHANLP